MRAVPGMECGCLGKFYGLFCLEVLSFSLDFSECECKECSSALFAAGYMVKKIALIDCRGI